MMPTRHAPFILLPFFDMPRLRAKRFLSYSCLAPRLFSCLSLVFVVLLSVMALPMATARHTKRATDFTGSVYFCLFSLCLCFLSIISYLFPFFLLTGDDDRSEERRGG